MRVIFWLIIVCFGWPSFLLANQIIVHPGAKDYRSLSLISYRGLPRLGEQAASANKETIEKHNYAFGLMTRLGFMAYANDCFAGMKGYEVIVEKCQGSLIEHGSQTDFWKAYIRNMAYSLTPDAHLQSFCSAEGYDCATVSVDRITVPNKNNLRSPIRAPNEFEKRDNAAKLFNQRHATFEAYRKDLKIPSEVYFVSKVQIGKYKFDHGRFDFLYRLPNNYPLASPNKGYRGPEVKRRVGNKALRAQPLYSRAISAMMVNAADRNSNNKAYRTQYHQNMQLPMNSDEARKLVEGNTRELYTVLKLKLLPWEMNPHRIVDQENRLTYQLADSRLELFRDSELTQKVASLNVKDPSKKLTASTQSGSDGNQYQVPEYASMLDFRTLSLLRLKQGNLSQSAEESIAQTLPSAERQLWGLYQRRLNELEQGKSMSNITSKQIRALKDATRLSSVSWQSSQNLKSKQRQAMFDYLLNIGADKSGALPWPKVLPSVDWGTNIVTVFDRGHFSLTPESRGVTADKSTQKLIRRFLKEAADSQQIKTLVLTYSLDNLQYDQKKQEMTFSSRQVPLRPMDLVQFSSDADNIVYKNKTEQLVSAGARNRVIYPLRTSISPVGRLIPNPTDLNYVRNNQNKSIECSTTFNSFLNQPFYSAFMALDKKLQIPNSIKMSQKKANWYYQNLKNPGWRLIIELDYEKMDIVAFKYRQHSDSGTNEAQTLFGKVRSVNIIDQDENVVWSKTGDKMPDAKKVTRLTASKRPDNASFPDGMVLSPMLNDFLLARFYPDQLSKRMLEAMLSSRWVYEQSQDQPIGGQFFNRDSRRPSYQDIQGVTQEFRQWLQSRADSLPEELMVEISLQYRQGTMSVVDRCLVVSTPKGSPVRNLNTAKLQANQKIRDCENQNRQLKENFQKCERLRDDLSQAETELTREETNGCGQSSSDIAGEDNTQKGPCDFTDLTLANMKTEMMNCLTTACGTPTGTTDMQKYQKCASDVTAQFQNEIRRLMGQAPRKKATKKEDTCRTAKRRVRKVKKDLSRYKCDSLTQTPELTDCTQISEVEQPDFMQVERIDLSSMHSCTRQAYAFDRRSKPSAELLPNGRPFSDMHYSFVLSVDKLALPYDLPLPGKKEGAIVKAMVKLFVKTAEKSLNRHGQFGLAAEVRGVKFKE